ncbi:MAG: AI-2E family transporter [Melioribacteraceae bacterium]|nr:AI-2E family transporter [Melioribacteraceae bacterium]
MKKFSTDPSVKLFISVLGLIAIFIVLKELQHIFIPFVLAYFLFFVFQPFNKFLTRKKFPEGLTVVIDIVIVVLILWGFSRVIIASFNEFGEAVPVYETKLNNIIRSTALSLGIDDPFMSDFNLLQYLEKTLDVGGLAGGFFSSTLSFFSTVFFVLFFFIFISGGHNKIVEAFRTRFSQPQDNEETTHIDRTFENIPEKIQNYIVTKLLISLITSISVGVVLWIFDIDFMVVWMVLTFLLNFIPNIGSVLAVIFPTLMALVQLESFGYALLFAGITTAIQNVIGNIVEPKIMGDKLGLNPIVILLSLLLWGYIWGLVGMFLSVPIIVVLKIAISESKSPNLTFINSLMG